MAAQPGKDYKLYYNSAEASAGVPDYASPTWVEICNVRDVTINKEANSSDISTRCGGGWRQKLAGLKEGTVEFEMVVDQSDAAYVYLQGKFDTGNPVHVASANGAIATSGTYVGFDAPMVVTNSSENQPLEEGVTANVTLEVTFDSTVAPTSYTVS